MNYNKEDTKLECYGYVIIRNHIKKIYFDLRQSHKHKIIIPNSVVAVNIFFPHRYKKNIKLPNSVRYFITNIHKSFNKIHISNKIIKLGNCAKYNNYNKINYNILSLAINNKNINGLNQIHTLDLITTKISDLGTLDNIHILNLSNTNITNINTKLKNVHTLILRSTKVTDVSALGNIHTLDLTNTNVTDVSSLGNAHTIKLYNTPVTDVSALASVRVILNDINIFE